MAERKQVDWESVERDYSAGLLSLRELADKYGVAHQVIARKAKKEDWSRDLSAKIAKAVDKKLGDKQVGDSLGDSKKATEKEIVQANAQAIVDIKLSHRTDISRGRNLVAALFGELEEATTNKELFEQLGELLRKENDHGQDKLNDIYQKVISMPQRIDGVKKLSEALRILIDKERQAFGITDAPTPTDDAIKDLLKGLGSNALNTQTTFDLDDDE